MVNLDRFKLLKSELDTVIELREVNGKVTRERYYLIKHIVRKFNNYNSAPYGVSPNGYRYTCGCIHDCCGCIVRRYATVAIHSEGFLVSIITTYNY